MVPVVGEWWEAGVGLTTGEGLMGISKSWEFRRGEWREWCSTTDSENSATVEECLGFRPSPRLGNDAEPMRRRVVNHCWWLLGNGSGDERSFVVVRGFVTKNMSSSREITNQSLFSWLVPERPMVVAMRGPVGATTGIHQRHQFRV